MKWILAFAATMVMLHTAAAEDFDLNIQGPSGAVQPGTMVVLTIAPGSPDVDAMSWQCGNADLQLLVVERGTICAFATAVKGQYVIILSAARVGESGKAELGTARKTIVVGDDIDPDPEPDPDPDPGPDPEPDPLPDGKYGLAPLAVKWCEELPDANEAGDLANAFRAVSSQVAAGAVKTVDNFKTLSTQVNRDAIGDQREKWLPWFMRLNDEMTRIEKGGGLNTVKDCAVAWDEVATGLEYFSSR